MKKNLVKKILLQKHASFTRGTTVYIDVPASKSLSNRYLILQALCRNRFDILNLSPANDTVLLHKLLSSFRTVTILDVEDAGTAARFLTAFLSVQQGGEWILRGTNRMHERPIEPLVNALRQLGADIRYLKKEGFLPLLIKGKKIRGGKISLDVSQSSQFLSALLLVSPELELLEINLSSRPVSFPYVKMTLEILKRCGAEICIDHNKIKIIARDLHCRQVVIENDWSSAAVWYAAVAISPDHYPSVFVKGLSSGSIQGDRRLAGYFEYFGVKTFFEQDGIRLEKKELERKKISLHLIDTPDIVPSLTITAAALGMETEFTGLQTLRLKETDRMQVLAEELKAMNINILHNNDSIFIEGGQRIKRADRPLKTFKDHRMAMAFAPLSLLFGELEIEDPDVVKKSYPDFWNQFNRLAKTNLYI